MQILFGQFHVSYFDEKNRTNTHICIDYINVKLKNIVINEGFIYIDLANIFDNNPRLFDKKDSFIPNNQGYLKISEKIV